MRKIIYLFVIAALAIACSNKEKKSADGGWDVTISGKVKFPREGGKLTIEELTYEGTPKLDSADLESDGSYSTSVHLTEPGYYRLNFYNIQMIDVVLDHSDIVVNVDGNDPSGGYEITGSPDYELIKGVQQQLMTLGESPEVKQLEADFQVAGQAKDDQKIAELQEKYLELHVQHLDQVINDLKSKPVNLGLINLLQGNTFEDKDRYYQFYMATADSAIAQMPTSVHVKQFHDMVTKMAITAIGVQAPEISLPDTNGKTVTLSSMRGKYVLVDFWAKWCGPCRRENPYVVRAYNEFKDKGLQILGVSLDRSKEDWLQGIKEDGLVWTQVSDLQYYQSQAALDYNVNAIPFSVLVDPNGVIIAKNLRRNALLKKLGEVLNNK